MNRGNSLSQIWLGLSATNHHGWKHIRSTENVFYQNMEARFFVVIYAAEENTLFCKKIPSRCSAIQ